MSEKPHAEEHPPESPQVVITDEEIFEAHVAGKLFVGLKSPLDSQRALSIAYTPGVGQVSRAIAADHTLSARYTWAVFRGALDAGARRITEKMKLAAAEAIFSVVGDDLALDRIVPSPLDPRVAPAVAQAVAAAADTSGD